jgi:hypothetical protein
VWKERQRIEGREEKGSRSRSYTSAEHRNHVAPLKEKERREAGEAGEAGQAQEQAAEQGGGVCGQQWQQLGERRASGGR